MFISSRFSEFSGLRKLLAHKLREVELHVIELDDNGADDRPPPEFCVGLIKHAELVVLILGDSYGPLAEGHELSHTHLEYRASQDADSDARVLPYFVQAVPGMVQDAAQEQFRQEVQRNHRTAEHVRPQEEQAWAELASAIFNDILRTLLELKFQEAGQGDDDLDYASGEEANAELQRLQNLRQQPMSELASMLAPLAIDSTVDALSQPRALEAYEQMKEARFALQIGERRIAERHLRCAVDLRPLDPAAAEWLARVLVSGGRRKSALEAVTLADRAARIYAKTEQSLRAAASLVLAARASADYDHALAIDYARAAVEQAGWYAQTHFELARQLSMANQADGALASLDRAFNCHPPIIEGVYNDPAFEKNREAVDGLIRDMHQRVGSVITGVTASETAMAKRLGLAPRNTRDLSADARLWRRVYACRDAVRRQMRELQNLAASYVSSVALNAPNDAASPVYVLEAAALSLHMQDALEISFLVSAGASVEAGKPVFRYRSANSRTSHTWHAPVGMKLVWTARTTSLHASDRVLTWSPLPEYTSAAEYRNLQASAQRALAQAQHRNAHLGIQKTTVGRKLMAGLAAICAGAASAYLLRAQTAPAMLLGMATLYTAYLCNQLRHQHVALRGALSECVRHIANEERQIGEAQRNLDALRRIENDRLELLREMVAMFERQSLSLVSVSMPFQGLRSARTGDWVIVALSSAKNYAKELGLALEVREDANLHAQSGKLSLHRVAHRSNSEIILERTSAYLPPRQA
ncbi:DUF4062 domain-containing protein [Pseudoduganella sp. FT26W]|uniref:DUF4062 domain-containing protein n=1 Tax=Duganella aquatilis TaxID=2666082 RepID=A0A844D2T6_9BURK|nr:DUF4062 domain-containing protein [Duganella aquatilis]